MCGLVIGMVLGGDVIFDILWHETCTTTSPKAILQHTCFTLRAVTRPFASVRPVSV
jgi:hypothetical protein